MSSSERSSSDESDGESSPDLHKLKPYDLEPEIVSLDGISTSSDEEELSSSDCEAESRIGKTYSYYVQYQHHCFNNKTKVFTQEHGPSTKVPRVYFIWLQQDIFLVSELLLYHVLIFYIVFL